MNVLDKKSRWVILTICFTFIIACVIYWSNASKNTTSCQIKVIPLYSYNDAQLDCGKNTLITFDVDNTLITTDDPTGLNYGFSNVPLSFKIHALLKYPSLFFHYEHITSLLFLHSPRILIERHVASFINHLKKRCAVVGLTSMESGPWGIIPSMPEWRYNMLTSMGIVFSTFVDRVFYNLPARREVHPVLYKGILCTNQEPKGAVLGAFIDTLEYSPSEVISFDDDHDALCSVAQACRDRSISFIGYHYVGVHFENQSLDFEYALRQLDGLINEDRLVIK